MAEGQSLLLSATELRTLTGWADPVIIEFLSLQSGVSEITQNISIVINEISQTITQVAYTENIVNGLQKSQSVLEDSLTAMDATMARIFAFAKNQQNQISALTEQVAGLNAANSSAYSRLSAQARQITALNEQITVADQSTNARLAQEIRARKDLEQQMQGM